MKKGETYEGIVSKVIFPNKGIVEVDGEKCIVKNVVKGQTVSFMVNKKKGGKCEGRLLNVIEKSSQEVTPKCPHFEQCGGCTYLNLPYDKQLEMKENQVREILEPVYTKYCTINGTDCDFDSVYEGIKASPVQYEYRNKMEFSFGDSCKGGELELGLHKRGSFYDILSVNKCQIVDEDYRKILFETLAYFRGKDVSYYHKINHEGFLRHLLVRKAVKTGEILIDLVTSSQLPKDTPCTQVSIIDDWKEALLELERNHEFNGKISGILHTVNDSLSDTVMNDKTEILYGVDYITEELLGLKFKISPFSFFQTNSLSAEVLYDTARNYILGADSELKESDAKKVIFDLYSGTGTIAQLLAPVAKKVIGVEIVSEAVDTAKINASFNGLNNCGFIAGDVLKVLDEIVDRPDFIVLDPPRDGVHPKALKKIIDYGVENLLYISCKPTSLARDLEMLMGNGYIPKRICAIDQFPGTVHVETVVLMSRVK